MGKVKWTYKASGHLQAIYEYIAKDSKIYAGNFIKSLIHATQKLETFPKCGRIVPELENYDFREVIYRKYRIVYRIKENSKDIEILAVIHGSRDMPNAFHEDWEL